MHLEDHSECVAKMTIGANTTYLEYIPNTIQKQPFNNIIILKSLDNDNLTDGVELFSFLCTNNEVSFSRSDF